MLELPIFELAAVTGDASAARRDPPVAAQFHAGMPLDEFRRLDRVFHTMIAAACGNPLLVELYGKVLDALFRSASSQSLLYDEANRERVDDIIGQSVLEHQAIATGGASRRSRRRRSTRPSVTSSTSSSAWSTSWCSR